MGFVWEWVRNITLVVILFSFVEILLPGSNMRNYLKFMFSLAVLAMMLSPFSALGQGDVSVSGYVPVSDELRQQLASDGNGQNGTGDSESISKIQTKQIETIYKEKLTSQLLDALKEKFPGITVASAEIYINNEVRSSRLGTPQKATVTISDPDYENRVREFTAEQLQIEKRSVTIALTGE